MINRAFLLLMALYVSDGRCGVSVVGTRFMIDDKMQHLNIKLVNDNESDYLIKSTLDDKDFIISPPLFLLKKNSSDMITVIPKENKGQGKDKTINFTVTSIPKSTANDSINSVAMAVRSHFKIIYRHKTLEKASLDKIIIIRENNKCQLFNPSDFSFTVSVHNKNKTSDSKVINITPGEKVSLDGAGLAPSCGGWIKFYNEFNDVIYTAKSPEVQ